MNKNDNQRWTSPIPPHLTREEREWWEKDHEWEKQEKERRKKEGLYDERPRKKIGGWKLIQKLFKKN